MGVTFDIVAIVANPDGHWASQSQDGLSSN